MFVDYDQIGPTYDTHRHGGGPYFSKLVQLARDTPGKRVLEIGAGTGNNAGLMASALSTTLVALEQSRGMLTQGAGKGLPARWVRGRGQCLPFRDGHFDFLFACYVLHHIPDLNIFFGECHRVLRAGAAAFVTVPEDFIARHPMNTYFPSFAKIDHARFQPIGDVIAALENVGFEIVSSVTTLAPPCPIDDTFVAKVEGRYISTYDLIPPAEFAQGLKRLKQDVGRLGALAEPMIREATVVWGIKRS